MRVLNFCKENYFDCKVLLTATLFTGGWARQKNLQSINIAGFSQHMLFICKIINGDAPHPIWFTWVMENRSIFIYPKLESKNRPQPAILTTIC